MWYFWESRPTSSVLLAGTSCNVYFPFQARAHRHVYISSSNPERCWMARYFFSFFFFFKTVVRCHEVGGNALTVCVLSGLRASSILVKGSANLLSFHMDILTLFFQSRSMNYLCLFVPSFSISFTRVIVFNVFVFHLVG